MYIFNQKFLILGVSKSGVAMADYLLKNNCSCYLFDDSVSNRTIENIKRLTESGAVSVLNENVENVIKDIDVLLISPGVPINHKVALIAKKYNKRIIGETEFAYSISCPTVVAVTGTNGKTTTVSLINEILNNTNINHELVGNVGTPFIDKIESNSSKSVYIDEISSFQLESISTFLPHIACVLNITPDHLERHYTMENYIFLKKRIFSNQHGSEYTVLNFDDETVKNFYTETNGKVIWVSLKERVDGAYLLDDNFYYFDECIMSCEKFTLSGVHNQLNALFSIAVAKLLGVNNEEIVKGLSEFKGVKHRLEKVAVINEVTYVNDSKSTNTDATIKAIDCMKNPFVLILGGSEKGETYDNLFIKLKESKCKMAILTGASRFNMTESALKVGYENISFISNFEVAVKTAKEYADCGDTVLLSPACASFDCFNGFEERGEKFIKMVEGFNEK